MEFAEVKEELLAWQRERGLEALEIYFFTEEGLKISKKDRKIETFKPYQERGLALRVIKDGALGFAYTSSLEQEAVFTTAEKALEMALSMPKEGATFPYPGAYPALSPEEGSLLLPEEALERLALMEEAAFSLDKRVKRIQEVSLKDFRGTLRLVNSNGVDLAWPYRATSLMALVIAGEGEEAQMGWEWRMARRPEELKPEEVVSTAAKRALWRLGARPLPSERVPVLIPPHVAVDFLELLSDSLSGENVCKGKSALAGKVGERVFSPEVTLVDHGLLEGGLETRPFDDEGFPQQETRLVEEGVLRGFLFDHYWGRRSGQGSTGNARRRGFKAPPSVGLTNFYLSPGKDEKEKIIASLPRVFELIEVLGMHTADPLSGDFSVGVSGLMHTREGITPVSGMALSGNVFELFKRIEALGDDLTFYGSVGAPSILVGAMDLAGG